VDATRQHEFPGVTGTSGVAHVEPGAPSWPQEQRTLINNDVAEDENGVRHSSRDSVPGPESSCRAPATPPRAQAVFAPWSNSLRMYGYRPCCPLCSRLTTDQRVGVRVPPVVPSESLAMDGFLISDRCGLSCEMPPDSHPDSHCWSSMAKFSTRDGLQDHT
jgi:hypothetical protein